jgi:hypothetical protein
MSNKRVTYKDILSLVERDVNFRANSHSLLFKCMYGKEMLKHGKKPDQAL